MLQKTSALVADAYRRAFESREKANAANNDTDREFFGGMERRWLLLAHSYEFTDRLSTMSDDLDRN